MRTLTPTNELPYQLREEGRIAWQLNSSPGVDPEAWAIDARATEGLLHAAGLGGLVVQYGTNGASIDQPEVMVSPYRGERDIEHASVTPRLDRAVAPTLGKTQNNLIPGSLWPTATVQINHWDITDKVVADRRNTTNPGSRDSVYMRHADRALRCGIMSAAVDNLIVEPLDRIDPMFAYLFGALTGPEIASGEGGYLSMVLGTFQAGWAAAALVRNKRLLSRFHPERVRLDLLPFGVQPLHLAGAGLRALRRPLLHSFPMPK